jgi:HAE1 family hydrophobic/amphiphilic exporter-1
MGMTVFSGMLVATVIGVLVVPAMYVIVERYLSRPKTPAADSTTEGAP